MLLRFRVSNYASLRDEQELSLVAADEHPGVATRPIPREDLRALPAVGILGQNASGKSNVLQALAFAARAVRVSHQRWLPEEGVPRRAFQLDLKSPTRPSTFVLELVVDGVRFEYGFAADDDAIRREWLSAFPLGKRRLWFERSDESLRFGSSLTGQREMIAELIRPNSLFLSAAAANNHRQLATVYRWISAHHLLSAPYPTPPPRAVPPARLMRLLRYADLGVTGAALVSPTPEQRERYRNRFATVAQEYRVRQGLDVDLEPELAPSVQLAHQAEAGDATLPWVWESSGTHTWWALLGPALRALDRGTILAIDDLGSGLHPLLTAQLIRLFQDPTANPRGAQLVFNTHDTGLLGRHHGVRLARDQVWLTEKDRSGATRLFPLTEFRVRDGLDDVEGRYLKGRYGAVPFFDEDLLAGLAEPPEPPR